MVNPSSRHAVILQRQFDGLAGPARAVNGADDFDGFAALASVYQEHAVGVDGVQEIAELVAVADVRDAARIAGAGFEAAGGGD
jgi:hypothetical protein